MKVVIFLVTLYILPLLVSMVYSMIIPSSFLHLLNLKLLDAGLIRECHLKNGDNYFKAGEMNGIKFQNFDNIFFKTKGKHKP